MQCRHRGHGGDGRQAEEGGPVETGVIIGPLAARDRSDQDAYLPVHPVHRPQSSQHPLAFDLDSAPRAQLHRPFRQHVLRPDRCRGGVRGAQLLAQLSGVLLCRHEVQGDGARPVPESDGKEECCVR